MQGEVIMGWIPKPTGFLNIKIPFQGPGGYSSTQEEWYLLVRNTIIEWACKQNVNKIICPNNLCFLFDDYKPGKYGVKIEFSSKYSNLIFIGDEVIEVID